MNAEQAAADLTTGLSERLASINERITAACSRSGRSASEVTLMGVSKTVAASAVRAAVESGLRVLGENRVQEAAAKIKELGDLKPHYDLQWHMIGHLQSNKARRAVELFDAVQSIDNLKLAERLNQMAGEMGRRLPILIEVNLGDEESKSGLEPAQVLQFCEQCDKLSCLELNGLMTVPPYLENPEELRPFFRLLRGLRDEAQRAGIVGPQFKDLSMGMSHDFEVAIEEGATLVRIGTAIFGERR